MKNDINSHKRFNRDDTCFLFCCDPLNKRKPDMDYIDEYEEVKAKGFNVLLFSYEDLIECGKVSLSQSEDIKRVIYRGWMLKPTDYDCLYNNLKDKNYYLINDTNEYLNAHYLPNWYKHIEGLTPKSIWSNNIPEKEEIVNMLKEFNSDPVIVKDYVKSRKHEWHKSCYIENAEETKNAVHVVDNFIRGQGEDLNQGVVLREFVKLEPVGVHNKSNMPISNELRMFILNNEIVCTIGYWDGQNVEEYPEYINQILKKLKQIKSNFFTVDIAKTLNNEWVIMELGDGQVSGLQDYEAKLFYNNLIKAL
jgi:hypothetical protein